MINWLHAAESLDKPIPHLPELFICNMLGEGGKEGGVHHTSIKLNMLFTSILPKIKICGGLGQHQTSHQWNLSCGK
jgi:hypothetical protein